MVLGLWKKAPKLEARFTPSLAVARELKREVEVAGELVLRNAGSAAEVSDLETVLVAGGTRRLHPQPPAARRGPPRPPPRGGGPPPRRRAGSSGPAWTGRWRWRRRCGRRPPRSR